MSWPTTSPNSRKRRGNAGSNKNKESAGTSLLRLSVQEQAKQSLQELVDHVRDLGGGSGAGVSEAIVAELMQSATELSEAILASLESLEQARLRLVRVLCSSEHNAFVAAIEGEVNIEDVKDEIFDMVKPEDPTRMTLQDLCRCGQGDTVVSMLTDVSGFWAYDNREALISSAGGGGDEEGGEVASLH